MHRIRPNPFLGVVLLTVLTLGSLAAQKPNKAGGEGNWQPKYQRDALTASQTASVLSAIGLINVNSPQGMALITKLYLGEYGTTAVWPPGVHGSTGPNYEGPGDKSRHDSKNGRNLTTLSYHDFDRNTGDYDPVGSLGPGGPTWDPILPKGTSALVRQIALLSLLLHELEHCGQDGHGPPPPGKEGEQEAEVEKEPYKNQVEFLQVWLSTLHGTPNHEPLEKYLKHVRDLQNRRK